MSSIRIPLCTVSIGEREQRRVGEALASAMISSAGPSVEAFERSLARRVGIEHVVATSSGTSALELALRAMNVGPGDEVIVPALTFAAPAAAVALVGAVPVIADVDEETWTLDPRDVQRRLTPRSRALIAVDLLGHPADYDRLVEFGLPILEDAAQAIGAAYKGRAVGTLGAAAIFSFHANKAITTGEGGALATNDPALADRARLFNNFGMHPSRRYVHEVAGHNHRMNNLTAAFGLAQVERWDELLGERRRVAARYDRALAGAPVRRRPVASFASESVWLYTIESGSRAAILQACAHRGIDARAVWPAVPDQPAFARCTAGPCPVARRLASRALWLPTWPGMPDDAIDEVASVVAETARAE